MSTERQLIDAAKRVIRLIMRQKNECPNKFTINEVAQMIDVWKSQVSPHGLLEILDDCPSGISPQFQYFVNTNVRACNRAIFSSTARASPSAPVAEGAADGAEGVPASEDPATTAE